MKKIGFYIGLLLAVLPFLKGADDHPLDSIIAIRSLESEVADQALPVALESQVVWVDPVRKAVFLYDGETGIYVRRKRPYDMNFVVHPGDLVKVVGVTQIGGFSNAIDEADMEVIGHAPLPEATMYHDNLRLSPLVDCDWMEISGRLVSVTPMDETYILVELRRNNFFLDLQVPYTEASEKRLQELLFGWVGVNAVAGTVYNDQRQATGRIFYANSGDDFRQLSPRESIRSDGPRFAIEELMQRDRPHNWVVNTSGLVTSVSGGELYLRGETASLKVSYTHADEVSLGDTVNIDGVITPGPISPAFRARNVTVVGKGNTPEPTQLEKVSGLIDTRRNYDLVEVDATLVEIGQSFSAGSRFRDTEMQTQLLCRADGRLFEARLPIGVQLDQDLRVGAELRLSGICHLIRNAELRWRLEVDGFWIQLRDGHDIKVLAAAPWWTAARLLWVMGGILVVLALFLVWVLLLQKTVEKQTAIIGEKVEHETILNERQRMARELHDNLDQGLTGAAIQLQASRKFLEKSGGRQVESVEAALAQVGDAELSAVLNEHIELLKEDATKSQSVLKSVQAMLSHCGEESRTSILELRGGLLERMDLPSALKEEMGPLAEESGAQTNVEIVGTPRRLKLKAERNLLMVAREAATNAARHAQPSRIDVTLRFDSDAVSLVISDDGAGFATSESHKAGHFGLRGMQERINRLNGKIDIESKLGVGTEIRIILSPINEWELDPA